MKPIALTATNKKNRTVASLATAQNHGIIDIMPTPEHPATQPPGSTIRALRKAKGWSLQQLADASGMDKATVSRIERNLSFELQSLLKIAGGLNVSLPDLFADAEYARWRGLPKAVREEIQAYAEARIALFLQHQKLLEKKE